MVKHKLIKIGLSLVTVLTLTGFRYDELGDLQDYKTTRFEERTMFINKIPFLLRFYNPRNDGIDDVVEYYEYKIDKNNRRYVDNPFLYVFDLNNNGIVDKGERLVDEDKDGLNGKEYWK